MKLRRSILLLICILFANIFLYAYGSTDLNTQNYREINDIIDKILNDIEGYQVIDIQGNDATNKFKKFATSRENIIIDDILEYLYNNKYSIQHIVEDIEVDHDFSSFSSDGISPSSIISRSHGRTYRRYITGKDTDGNLHVVLAEFSIYGSLSFDANTGEITYWRSPKVEVTFNKETIVRSISVSPGNLSNKNRTINHNFTIKSYYVRRFPHFDVPEHVTLTDIVQYYSYTPMAH